MKKKNWIKSLENVDVLDTWRISIEEIEDEIRALRRKLSKIKKERKSQPAIIYKALIGDDIYYANQWYIRDSVMIMENKRKATPEEIAWFKGEDDDNMQKI